MEVDAHLSLWMSGEIAEWYLFPYQMGPHRLLKRERFPFLEQSRRTGKTTEVLVHVLEELQANSNWFARWCEPWKHQARDIIMPEIESIQSGIPRKYKAKYVNTDSYYKFHNGSRMYLRGVNDDKGESARGPKAHILVGDEYGSWNDPRYIVNSVLLPQLLSTNGQFIRMGSAPKNLGHKYYEDRELALRAGRLCSITIEDSVGQLYTRQQIDDMAREVGGALGKRSIEWRREFMNEPVGDPTLLVIPEFLDNSEGIVYEERTRPSHFDIYVGGDSGFDDNSFFVLGYYDFLEDTLVIEREYFANHLLTSQKIKNVREIEKEIYGEQKPYRRVLDGDKQLIYDISNEFDFNVMLPDKADKRASINSLRDRVRRQKIKIHASCESLIKQLKVGIWKNDLKTDFERTEGLGHLDGIAALMYMNRSIDLTKNPYPPLLGASQSTHFIHPEYRKERELGSSETLSLRKIYGK